MSTAVQGNPQLFQDDQIIVGKRTGTTVITKGDWLQFSGGFLINLVAAVGLTGLRASAAGVALDNHPVYDPLGRSMENTAMPVLTHGVLRVSGGMRPASPARLRSAPTSSRQQPRAASSDRPGQPGSAVCGLPQRRSARPDRAGLQGRRLRASVN